MAEHSTLTGSSLHEPKGAATANVGEAYIADGVGSGTWQIPEVKGTPLTDSGKIYVSDGAGSGTWVWSPHGWGHYKDNGVGQIVGTSFTKLQINKLDPLTNEDYLPPSILGTGTLWDAVNNIITPLEVGDVYMVRLNLPVSAKSGSPSNILVEFDIGGAATPTIVVASTELVITSAPPYILTMPVPLFSLDTFLANGCQIFLKTDTGTATVSSPELFITRISSGEI